MSEIPPENDELHGSSSVSEAVALVPPIEAIVGYWFACGEVHIVFDEGDGRQFYLLKDTLERSHGNFLTPGQTWSRRDEPVPLQGAGRIEGLLRAYHEAG